MSEPTGQLDRDEDRRRAYLLGRLSETERDDLEARFFDDEDEFARLLETQYDLIDAHARGELSAADDAQVEEQLLAPPVGRRRAQFARALHRQGLRSNQETDPRPSATRRLLSGRWPGVLVAASLVAMVWLGLDNARLRRQLSSSDAQPAAVDAGPPQSVPDSRSGEAQVSAIAEVTLSPRVLRSDQDLQVVQVSPLSQVVRLTLPIDEAADSFTVALERAGSGRVLTHAGAGRSEQGTISVWVPRDTLRAGDYEALVWRGRETPADLVGVYTFRVR